MATPESYSHAARACQAANKLEEAQRLLSEMKNSFPTANIDVAAASAVEFEKEPAAAAATSAATAAAAAAATGGREGR